MTLLKHPLRIEPGFTILCVWDALKTDGSIPRKRTLLRVVRKAGLPK